MNTSCDEPEQDIFKTPNIDKGQDRDIIQTSFFPKTAKKMKSSN